MKGFCDNTSTSEQTGFVWTAREVTVDAVTMHPVPQKRPFTPLQPIRRWLDSIEIHDPDTAHRICKLIPAQCPFERTVKLFGRTLFYIPPLCKLNPFYEEVVGLRFRALCYLTDVCGEDISCYC
jgi:hypothetical protein